MLMLISASLVQQKAALCCAPSQLTGEPGVEPSPVAARQARQCARLNLVAGFLEFSPFPFQAAFLKHGLLISHSLISVSPSRVSPGTKIVQPCSAVLPSPCRACACAYSRTEFPSLSFISPKVFRVPGACSSHQLATSLKQQSTSFTALACPSFLYCALSSLGSIDSASSVTLLSIQFIHFYPNILT